MTTLVAPVCGPILGGYISDNYSWRWIFLINGPVGIACTLVCWRYLRKRETPTRKLPVDTIGFAFLLIWVGTLQVMLDTGKDADWFSATPIIIEAIVAAIAFAAWLIWELTETNPIVSLSLFKNRNFALGTLAFSLSYGVFFGINLLLPLWLQTQVGYIATWAGMVAAPSGVIAILLTPIGAKLAPKIDARIIATVALLAFAGSSWMRAGYTPDATFWAYVKPGLVQGIGMSLFFTSMLTIALRDVPPAQVPAASGLLNFSRITAGSFAASITTTVWDNREALHQTRLAEAAGANTPGWQDAIQGMQRLGMSLSQSVANVTGTFVRQAYVMAALDFFWASAVITLLLVPLIWLTKHAVSQGAAPAAD